MSFWPVYIYLSLKNLFFTFPTRPISWQQFPSTLLFLAVLDLHCCMGFALVVASGNCSLLQCMGFSLLWPLWLWSKGFSSCGTWAVVAAPRLQGTGSIAVVRLVSYSTACGIFPARDQNRVSCIGRQILYHWACREALSLFFSWESLFFPSLFNDNFLDTEF